MIHGIFLTPQAFGELGRTYGERDGLEALKELLFPKRSVCDNILVVDPQTDHWWQQVIRIAWSLPPQSKHKALELLQRIEAHAMAQARSSRDVPQREQQWVKLATKEATNLIDWVLCSRDAQDLENGERVFTCALVYDEAWVADSFPWQSSFRRTGLGQRRLLQRLCELSDWCVIELPYIQGEDSDEIVTAKQVAQLASQRAVPWGNAFTLDIICQTRRLENATRVRNVGKSLQETPVMPEREVRIRVFADDATLNRNFLAGTFQHVSNGPPTRSPRWSIRAQHVAVGSSSTGDERFDDNGWSF